jgi:AbrB family looped-hinge helix DNA binding protein
MLLLETTRMSSRGQVVIPEQVRRRLGLQPGTQFVVVAEQDVVILRAILPPSMDEFDRLAAEARAAARRARMKRGDIQPAVSKARSGRRKRREAT